METVTPPQSYVFDLYPAMSTIQHLVMQKKGELPKDFDSYQYALGLYELRIWGWRDHGMKPFEVAQQWDVSQEFVLEMDEYVGDVIRFQFDHLDAVNIPQSKIFEIERLTQSTAMIHAKEFRSLVNPPRTAEQQLADTIKQGMANGDYYPENIRALAESVR